jgi:tetratricopeptide (TPR) repeat protein
MTAEMPEHDYYEILQVHPKATLTVIKKAYRTLLLELGNHPDQGGSAEASSLITEAYKVLSDPERRAEYDELYMGNLQAYGRVDTKSKAKASKTAGAASGAATDNAGLIVLCPRCQTKNRVRSQELLSVAKCSRCGQSLSKLPNPLADLREHLLAAIGPRLGVKRKPASKVLTIGVPMALLAVCALAVGYTLSEPYLTGVNDPLTATDKLKKEGKYDQAATVLRRAVEREPANPRLHEKLGEIYNKQMLHEEAVGEYDLAIKLNPQNSYLYTLKGNTYMLLSRSAEAELCFKQALKLDPEQTPALVALGNVYAKQQRFKDAAGLYQKALNQRANADVFYNLGMVYQWDNQRNEASRAFMQALIADPNHRSSMVSLGSLYYEQGKYDQAAAQLIKASYLQHTDLTLHLRLADIYERTGRKQEAIKEWEVCVTQAKDNPTIQENARKALKRLTVTSSG